MHVHRFPWRKENALGGAYNVTTEAQITLPNICSCKSRTQRNVVITTTILKKYMLELMNIVIANTI
jgi:hypothetical protein